MKKFNYFVLMIAACGLCIATIHLKVGKTSYFMKTYVSGMSWVYDESFNWQPFWQRDLRTSTTLPTTTVLSATEPPSCRETSNFVFIKTHKTGSTTLKAITTRFGYFRNLSFVLGSNQVIGHVFSIPLKSKVPKIMPPIGVETGDYENYKNYNISDVHIQFHPDLMKRLMYPAADLKYITILREPTEQWISNFQYYHVYKKVGLKFDTLNQTLLPFLKGKNHSKLSYNRQSVDLGLKSKIPQSNSINFLNHTFREMKNLLSFVLITEYFDESLLILKKLFCWSFKDILYVKQRVQPERLVVDGKTRKLIKTLNWADAIIYDYYLKELWKKVEEYGPSFENDLKKFRDLLKKWSDTCVETSVAEVSVDRHFFIHNVATRNSSEFCWALVNSKFHVEIELVRRQGRKSDVRWGKFGVLT